jgi:uncharacterized protein
MKYIHRWAEQQIKEALESHPVVILTGPRQVGKSTLLEFAGFLKGWKYITLDDPEALEQAQEDPKGLLHEDTPLIIDEVQRCPELFLTIKYMVDKSRRRRTFVLSGSGNISLRKAPRETLAGRARYIHLTGLSFRECEGRALQKGILAQLWQGQSIGKKRRAGKNVSAEVWKGGLPGILLSASHKIAVDRMSSYIDTYIERDIQDLVQIRHPQNFRRLMESLARSTGWESVQEELSKDCGEERSNVSRYMSLLKETKLLYELKGYVARGERAYKQSKYYWFDSGVACFLSGIYSPKELMKPQVQGRFFENYVLQQIISWATLQTVIPAIYYWKRKAQDVEVDFVVQGARQAVGIEVKSSDTVSFKDTKAMREFLKTHPEAGTGMIVYNGPDVVPVASNIWAVPWTML